MMNRRLLPAFGPNTLPRRSTERCHVMKNGLRKIIGRSSALALAVVLVAVAGCSDDGVAVTEPAFEALQTAAAQASWPEAISIPIGFEGEGIELGKGHEFFVGAFSFSSVFGPAFGVSHPLSEFAGAIYKGNLRTGEGAILVSPTDKPVAGLSYDPRTDYLYAATGFGD